MVLLMDMGVISMKMVTFSSEENGNTESFLRENYSPKANISNRFQEFLKFHTLDGDIVHEYRL